MNAPVFALKRVSRSFGEVSALTQIDLNIFAGERVALIGPSGAGKSTLLGLLNGTLSPSAGEVWVAGQDLRHVTARSLRQVQRQIGTIHQQYHLVDSLRVIHNVNCGHLGRWSCLKAALSLVWPLEVETARKALTQVGIPEKLYARTDQLSGGQQQRVALARVLVQDPLAILADEPTSNLDPELGRQIMDLLTACSQQDGKTLVMSLHMLEFAYSHCDRMIGLRAGRILFDATVDQVSPAMIEQLYRRGA
ncbi:phosphonate ABC transporter ATP-binding protein [Anthocerotibacter panamensis]|uniref:phosphonate ABC transporter ATP-binding protein n=1 Tax=Anthocerotibacter panamensis TaxID=2857077 RepID=UPI001C4066C1|nr:ATP-binding cassette domain-containing protein [Anthocerotibacter panamensis]